MLTMQHGCCMACTKKNSQETKQDRRTPACLLYENCKKNPSSEGLTFCFMGRIILESEVFSEKGLNFLTSYFFLLLTKNLCR